MQFYKNNKEATYMHISLFKFIPDKNEYFKLMSKTEIYNNNDKKRQIFFPKNIIF